MPAMEKVGMLIDQLDAKQQETVKIIKKLHNENKAMALELDFLRKESKKHKKDMIEYEILRKKVDSSVLKIERLLKKIDTVKG